MTENIFANSTTEGRIQRRGKLLKKALALIARVGMSLDVDRTASGQIGARRTDVALGFELDVITMVLLDGVSIFGAKARW